MSMGRKRYFRQLLHGASRCWKCGHKFGRNEKRFYLYPPVLGGEQICEVCKSKGEREVVA